ncbi:aldehyde dehydrogenase family protein [Trebonia sp.]|uniref:aldehyde dehydrogenase family protein n=1 Tax=Trebonia sp. TaxID=2767075 RepID=UPI002636EF02|nr:aldehyde dehydrogenase family protein [Trebonia sp.]
MTSPHFVPRGQFIEGRWEDAGAGEVKILNPATEEVLTVVPEATVGQTEAALGAARRAFDDGPWPTMPPAERGRLLTRMADALDRRRAEIIELIIAETGCPRRIATPLQVGYPLDVFRDFGERIAPRLELERPMLPHTRDRRSLGQGVVQRQPSGVAALLSAFNFPLGLNIYKAGPALTAGCTAVLKPSPYTPLSALILAEAAEEADLPPGVLNVVVGDVPVGERLTVSPLVDVVSFTGSDAVGRKVYQQAAGGLKRVILELGGKSATIIAEDADLPRAASSILTAMTLHAGQGCDLLTRTFVHRSRFDELLGIVRGALADVVIGDPRDQATTLGPLMSAGQRDRVESYVELGRSEGATVAAGGRRPTSPDRGFFYEPTLFTDATNNMRIAREEIFGPVAVMMAFETEDEAVALANDSEYGLGGAVWAHDPARAYRIASRLRTGYVLVNGGGSPLSPFGPFGGLKASGIGREWGESGVAEFLEDKSIVWSVVGG